jgi:hypothetical protein
MRSVIPSRTKIFNRSISYFVALGAIVVPMGIALAAEANPPANAAARHGGVMTLTKAHAFETVLAPHGIRVYIDTEEQTPAMVEKATGVATITLADGKTTTVKLVAEAPGGNEPATYFCPMHAEVIQDKPGECTLCGGMKLFKQDRLHGQVDLSKIKPEELKLSVKVSGMRGTEKEVTFSPAFRAPDRKAEGTKSGATTN